MMKDHGRDHFVFTILLNVITKYWVLQNKAWSARRPSFFFVKAYTCICEILFRVGIHYENTPIQIY